MPRKTRCRKVCCDYGNRRFHTEDRRDTQHITVEEVEAMRLCTRSCCRHDGGLPWNLSAHPLCGTKESGYGVGGRRRPFDWRRSL